MSSYYSDPTGNIACGAVDREFKKLEKEAMQQEDVELA